MFWSVETRRQGTHRWRAVSEQQQEEQRLQHHGQRPHPERRVPPPPPPPRPQLIFTCACTGGLASHLRHYAQGKKKPVKGGGNTHPLARVTHASCGRVTSREGRAEKKVCDRDDHGREGWHQPESRSWLPSWRFCVTSMHPQLRATKVTAVWIHRKWEARDRSSVALVISNHNRNVIILGIISHSVQNSHSGMP